MQEAASGIPFYVILSFLTQLSVAYKVYWNIPTEMCRIKYNMSFEYVRRDYGITINDQDTFKGNQITILYNPGLFPEVKGYKYSMPLNILDESKMEFINGGLPQAGDMMSHLDAFEAQVNEAVPDIRNNGLIIIDMEHFGLTWAQNFLDMEIYQILSKQRVIRNSPLFNVLDLESQAKLEYEIAAARFIVKTLQYGKVIRSYATWGYYQYPQCFNSVGVDFCSTSTREDNDQMIILWKESQALFPSIYLAREGSAEEKAKQIRGKVREAKRVFKSANNSGLVLPYATYKYYSEDGYILEEDLLNAIAVPKEEGADGVVIWGSSYDFISREKCQAFDNYVKKSLGPIAKKYISEKSY